ncbi:preprotein translocase subunit SecG [Millisia brevis]|uniref:preprotein translocase subunit SecG n=1 Tax=Millisia brevis TaxID=264148 RepID=UPI00082CBA35|nr:preprotein translocase subunit SecG [Millisia brevis]
MSLFLDILLVVTSLGLILMVLLHRGKGGGLSSLFGGGVQSNLSGSTVAEKNLDRITVFVGLVWLIAILGIGLEIKFG